MYRHFETEQRGDVMVVRLTDPKLTDNSYIGELSDELLLLVQREPTKKLVVNFRKVLHCSTAVINGLLRVKKKLLADHGQVKLCEMHPTIREAYKLLNLDGTVFYIHDAETDALVAFRDG